jgi:hypothetical protein
MAWQDSDITGGKVRLKHSSVTSETIGASGLVPGEIVLNTADAKFYYRKADGTVGYIPAQGVESINGQSGEVSLNVVSIGGGTIADTGVSVSWWDSSPGYGLSLIDNLTQTQAIFGPLDTIIPGSVTMSGLPTSDPAVAGRLWNDGGTVKVSAGA